MQEKTNTADQLETKMNEMASKILTLENDLQVSTYHICILINIAKYKYGNKIFSFI